MFILLNRLATSPDERAERPLPQLEVTARRDSFSTRRPMEGLHRVSLDVGGNALCESKIQVQEAAVAAMYLYRLYKSCESSEEDAVQGVQATIQDHLAKAAKIGTALCQKLLPEEGHSYSPLQVVFGNQQKGSIPKLRWAESDAS